MKSLTINNKTPLPYSTREGLNRLRINFNFCGDQYKKVLITSSTPDEGKSFVCYNLWRMLAESGTHAELMAAGGIYHHLFSTQAKHYILAEKSLEP